MNLINACLQAQKRTLIALWWVLFDIQGTAERLDYYQSHQTAHGNARSAHETCQLCFLGHQTVYIYFTRHEHVLTLFLSRTLTPPHLAFANGCYQTSPGNAQHTYERLAIYVFLGAKLSYTSWGTHTLTHSLFFSQAVTPSHHVLANGCLFIRLSRPWSTVREKRRAHIVSHIGSTRTNIESKKYITKLRIYTVF